MKWTILVFVCLFGSITNAQVKLLPDSSYVQDGALVLRFKLVNHTPKTLVLVMDKRSSLQQLNAKHWDELTTSSSPQHGIVFFTKGVFIDEEPASCDQQLPQYETYTLNQSAEKIFLFRTHCLSERVLDQLNKGRTIRYKMIIRFKEGESMHSVETPITKLKVKKPKY